MSKIYRRRWLEVKGTIESSATMVQTLADKFTEQASKPESTIHRVGLLTFDKPVYLALKLMSTQNNYFINSLLENNLWPVPREMGPIAEVGFFDRQSGNFPYFTGFVSYQNRFGILTEYIKGIEEFSVTVDKPDVRVLRIRTEKGLEDFVVTPKHMSTADYEKGLEYLNDRIKLDEMKIDGNGKSIVKPLYRTAG